MNRWHVLTGIVVLCATMLVQVGTAQNQTPNRRELRSAGRIIPTTNLKTLPGIVQRTHIIHKVPRNVQTSVPRNVQTSVPRNNRVRTMNKGVPASEQRAAIMKATATAASSSGTPGKKKGCGCGGRKRT